MITSLENKKVKDLTRLHLKKYHQKHFLLSEKDLIDLARELNMLELLIYTGNKPFEFNNCLEVSQEVLNKISQQESLKYLGVCKTIKENRSYGNRVLLLDNLQDPANIGKIMHGCLLFGFDSLILSKNCADIYHEKCLHDCFGGIYKLHISFQDLNEAIIDLRKQGFGIYATGLKKESIELHELKEKAKMAFIMGNEGSGVSEQLLENADEVVKIAMCNIDSLNVAMATSIVLYQFSNI